MTRASSWLADTRLCSNAPEQLVQLLPAGPSETITVPDESGNFVGSDDLATGVTGSAGAFCDGTLRPAFVVS